MRKITWLVICCFLLTAFTGCDISSNLPSVTDTDEPSANESESAPNEETTTKETTTKETTAEEGTTKEATTEEATTEEATTEETTAEEGTTKEATTEEATTEEATTETNINYASVISGKNSVEPVQKMLWTEFIYESEMVSGDGFGYLYYVESPDADLTEIPELTYDGELKVITSSKYSQFRIFDLNFKELDESDPANLKAGEYYVSFNIRYDNGKGGETSNDCIFKLIVKS